MEQVSWLDCTATLEKLDLVLPTEAQWEVAARAGTTTPWWTGPEKQSLAGVANVTDRFARHNGGPASWQYEDWLDDGYLVHAPVGQFRPNGYGLHDVHGNLWEWCRDRFGAYEENERAGDDAELIVPGAPNRVNRGGSYSNPAIHARVSSRFSNSAGARHLNLGVRPARRVSND